MKYLPIHIINILLFHFSYGQETVFYDEVIRIKEDSITFKMALVPGGVFKMGSSKNEANREEDEGPVHLVKVDSLWVGIYEVTWEVFDLFLQKNKDLRPVKRESTNLDNKLDGITRPSPPFQDPSRGMGRENYPVINISPYTALTFCKWLTTYTGTFYRLPTEAEWEYVCRAGTETAYNFGDDPSMLDEYAVYYENSYGQYVTVGSKKPNKWGVYDMHGNVAEWTLDLYEQNFYTSMDIDTLDNPWNIPYVIHPRVYRGGSWDDDPEDLRSAKRSASGLNLQRDDPQVPKSFWWYTNAEFIGFRLVRPVKEISEEEIRNFWMITLDEG
ncbi:MAG: formylglycine-generating enzyme family protein [Cyclobacteriaceae bacterium]